MEDMGGNEKQPMNTPPENTNNPRQPPPTQPPQQCPRCNSFNTKFCYYNNYSLSQPRYFCKSCRRYWTQGGTLRNVPVGGGCRKGAKRLIKGGHASGANSSSCSSSFIGECSRAHEQLPPPPPPPPLPPPPPSPALPPLPSRGFSNMGLPFQNSFYSQSGLLSSFAAMQNLNRPQGFNQVPLNGGGGHFSGIGSSSSSNLSILQGFSGNNPNIMRAPPQVVLQHPIYRSPDAQMMVQPPNRSLGSWTQGFINNPSASNTNVSWAQSMLLQPNNNISPSEAAMNNPNQWPDHDVHEVDHHLPGYGPPPPSS